MSQSDGINPESSTAMEERRRHRRRTGFWSAQLETTTGQRLDCIVLDVSDSGAKLRIKHSIAVGDLMTLSGKRFVPRGVRVAWAAGERAGLVFLSAPGEARDRGEPAFLRSRAAVLRRLAELVDEENGGARLMRLADKLAADADRIEEQKGSPPPSIRRNQRPMPVDQ